jgi:hypothetical protein
MNDRLRLCGWAVLVVLGCGLAYPLGRISPNLIIDLAALIGGVVALGVAGGRLLRRSVRPTFLAVYGAGIVAIFYILVGLIVDEGIHQCSDGNPLCMGFIAAGGLVLAVLAYPTFLLGAVIGNRIR